MWRQEVVSASVELEQPFPAEHGVPAIRADEPGEDPQKRRLACPVGTQHGHCFRGLQCEGNVKVARAQRGVEVQGHSDSASSASGRDRGRESPTTATATATSSRESATAASASVSR